VSVIAFERPLRDVDHRVRVEDLPWLSGGVDDAFVHPAIVHRAGEPRDSDDDERCACTSAESSAPDHLTSRFDAQRNEALLESSFSSVFMLRRAMW
jgi:hypothetical protein